MMKSALAQHLVYISQLHMMIGKESALTLRLCLGQPLAQSQEKTWMLCASLGCLSCMNIPENMRLIVQASVLSDKT